MSHFYDPDLMAELRDAGRMVARAPEQDDAADQPCASSPLANGDHLWTKKDPACRYCGTIMEDESRGHH